MQDLLLFGAMAANAAALRRFCLPGLLTFICCSMQPGYPARDSRKVLWFRACCHNLPGSGADDIWVQRRMYASSNLAAA